MSSADTSPAALNRDDIALRYLDQLPFTPYPVQEQALESFTARSLELANKSFNVVESYAEIVARVHAHGITVQAGILFGFDGDGGATFEKTLAQATRLGLDGATVSLLTPFPGTPLFEELRRSGRLLTQDWSYYNGKTAVAFRPAR